MLSDPIADFLTRIKNGYAASKDAIEAPYSRIKEEIAKILKHHSFIKDFSVSKNGKLMQIKVELLYKDKKKTPPLTVIQRISRPGLRRYAGVSKLRPVLGGFGIAIVSTSQGLMTDGQAKRRKIGGEVIAHIY